MLRAVLEVRIAVVILGALTGSLPFLRKVARVYVGALVSTDWRCRFGSHDTGSRDDVTVLGASIAQMLTRLLRAISALVRMPGERLPVEVRASLGQRCGRSAATYRLTTNSGSFEAGGFTR